MSNPTHIWKIKFYYNRRGLSSANQFHLENMLQVDVLILINLFAKLQLSEHRFERPNFKSYNRSSDLTKRSSLLQSDNDQYIIKVHINSNINNGGSYWDDVSNTIFIRKEDVHYVQLLIHEVFHRILQENDDLHDYLLGQGSRFRPCLNSWYSLVNPFSLMITKKQQQFINDQSYGLSNNVDIGQNKFPLDLQHYISLDSFNCCGNINITGNDIKHIRYLLNGEVLTTFIEAVIDLLRNHACIQDLAISSIPDFVQNISSGLPTQKSHKKRSFERQKKSITRKIIILVLLIANEKKLKALNSTRSKLYQLHKKAAIYLTDSINIGYKFYLEVSINREKNISKRRIKKLKLLSRKFSKRK